MSPTHMTYSSSNLGKRVTLETLITNYAARGFTGVVIDLKTPRGPGSR
jgi:hypothetical protein